MKMTEKDKARIGVLADRINGMVAAEVKRVLSRNHSDVAINVLMNVGITALSKTLAMTDTSMRDHVFASVMATIQANSKVIHADAETRVLFDKLTQKE